MRIALFAHGGLWLLRGPSNPLRWNRGTAALVHARSPISVDVYISSDSHFLSYLDIQQRSTSRAHPIVIPRKSLSTTMSDVRKRTAPASTMDSKTSTTTPVSTKTKSDARFRATDILRILGGLLLLNAALSYFVTSYSVTWGYRPWWSKPRQLQAFLVWPNPVRVSYLGIPWTNRFSPAQCV